MRNLKSKEQKKEGTFVHHGEQWKQRGRQQQEDTKFAEFAGSPQVSRHSFRPINSRERRIENISFHKTIKER